MHVYIKALCNVLYIKRHLHIQIRTVTLRMST